MTAASPAKAAGGAVLDLGCHTDRGGREHNEDTAMVLRVKGGVLAVVADGMGGGEIGRTMSQQAEAVLRESLREPSVDEPRTQIEQAVQLANQMLLNLIQVNPARFARSGSTLVCALVQQHEREAIAHIGNVGDSRAYLLPASGPLRQLTVDHTRAWQLRDQGMPHEQADKDPAAHKLIYTLGMELDVQYVPNFYLRQRLTPGDCLILCSDGLSGFLGNVAELGNLLRGVSAQRAAERLVQRAQQNKTDDNATAVVVRYGVSPRPAVPWLKLLAVFGFLGLILTLSVLVARLLPTIPVTPTAEPTVGTVIGAVTTVTSQPTEHPIATLEESGSNLLPTSTRMPSPTPTFTPTPTTTRTSVPRPLPTRTPTQTTVAPPPTLEVPPTIAPPPTLEVPPTIAPPPTLEVPPTIAPPILEIPPTIAPSVTSR